MLTSGTGFSLPDSLQSFEVSYLMTQVLKCVTPISLLRTPCRILFRLGFVSVTDEEEEPPTGRQDDRTTADQADKPTGQQAFRFHT